jgi:hypothetical protein
MASPSAADAASSSVGAEDPAEAKLRFEVRLTPRHVTHKGCKLSRRMCSVIRGVAGGVGVRPGPCQPRVSALYRIQTLKPPSSCNLADFGLPAICSDIASVTCLLDLAQHRYFDDGKFVDYIEYLQYWRELPYCLYIVFPQCLRMLELLQSESFVSALKHAEFKNKLQLQQHWHWKRRLDPPPILQVEGGDAVTEAADTK